MASAGDAPKAPDPNVTIQAQEQANRYNVNNPFGSSSWSSGGPGGHDTLSTTMSPQMQGMLDQAYGNASAPRQQLVAPEGMNQLASAILGRVGARYGLGTGNANNPTIPGMQGAPHGGGGALNTNMAKGGQAPSQPGLGGMPQMGAPQGNPQTSLAQMMAAMQGQAGGGGVGGAGAQGNPFGGGMSPFAGSMPGVTMQSPGASTMPVQRMMTGG